MNRNYVGVSQRTFQQAAIHLLETEYGFLNSGRVLTLLAEDMAQLADQFHPTTSHVPPGWLVFTGTRVTGRKAQPGQSAGDYPLVTLAWPVVLPEDIEAIKQMPAGPDGQRQRTDLLKKRLQRLITHGLTQPDGPVVLTTADLALMLGLSTAQVSDYLIARRQETGLPLPTKGYFFDQGVRPSHKAQIITAYEQGLDEAQIARATNHAPRSVGRYLRDYERIKLLLRHHTPIAEIPLLTALQPSVVADYLALIKQFHPDLLPQADSPPIGS
jgi:hypothetical protein